MPRQRVTGLVAVLRCVLLGVVGLLVTTGGLLGVAAPARAADDAPRVLLVLDVSGSMKGRISSGGSKLAAAKRALKQVAATLPAGTPVGLRVYGSQISEPREENPEACRDTRLVLPVEPLVRSRMDAAIVSFDAKGETPIAYSLGKAVDDLGGSGKRVLILVSDGQETCGGDPCRVAKKLAERGVDLQFNAIGLAVNAKARSQLQCVAKAGGGAYYDAGNTTALESALRRLTQRALRPFEVAGTRVAASSDPAAAPVIGPGEYRDSFNGSGSPRYYTISRTPGSEVTVSVSSVVRPYGVVDNDQFPVKLTTMDGQLCSSGGAGSVVFKAASVYSVAVRSARSEDPMAPPGGCAADPQLRVELSRVSSGDASEPVPVGVLVGEQLSVLNRADLPAPVSGYSGKGSPVAPAGTATAVVGGSGFSNAPEIGPGGWSDSVALGDTAIYRVHLDYGQSLRVTASLPGGGGRLPLGGLDEFIARLRVLTPARVQAVSQEQTRALRPRLRLSAASPQVRVRNDEVTLPLTQNFQPDASTASVAGDYYVALQLEPAANDLGGVVLPVRYDVAVEGTPSGLPVLAAASPTPASPAPAATTGTADQPSSTPAPAPTAEDGGAGLLVGGVLVAALVVVAGAAAGLSWRRRRSTRSRRPGNEP